MWSTNMKTGGFGFVLGGQKSSKMMTFSKHEKHEKSMAGAANLRLEGGQKSVKNESKKTKKQENPDTRQKHQK